LYDCNIEIEGEFSWLIYSKIDYFTAKNYIVCVCVCVRETVCVYVIVHMCVIVSQFITISSQPVAVVVTAGTAVGYIAAELHTN
jgi:hypothetical protein